MNASVLVNALVGALFLPPLILVAMAALGLLVRKTSPRIGNGITVLALILLLILSSQAGARLVLAPLERMTQPLATPVDTHAQAIVVLGGGRISAAPEYASADAPSPIGLLRLRYAAALHRQTGLPILVTGGRPDGAAESEAAVMARSLAEDFGVPVQWLEEASNNTAQNAQLSAAMLREAGVMHILLVTDATHMSRASFVFAKTGLQITEAPTVFFTRRPLNVRDFIPEGEAMRRSHYAMHEWVGMAWYAVREALRTH